MSKFTVPLVMVAAVAVAGAAWQTHQLSSERTNTAALARSVADLNKRIDELGKEAARLREQNAVYQSESEQLRTKLAGKATAPASSVTEAHDASADIIPAAEGGQKKGEAKNFMQSMARMMKDPEMKKAMRSQQALGLHMVYGDLAKELGLDPEQAAEIMELITDRQLTQSEKSMELMSGGQEAGKLEELSKTINASREEFDKQIADALGVDKYQQFQEFERSIGERFAVGQIQQQFTAKGMPMDETTRNSLLTIMAEERRNSPADGWDPSGGNVAEQIKTMQSDEAFARLIERQKQTNLRILSRATAFLSPDQVNQLRESQEQFLRMQEMGMKMGRQMIQGQ